MQAQTSSDAFLVEDLLNFDEHEEPSDQDLEDAKKDSCLTALDHDSLASSLSSSEIAGDFCSHGFSVPVSRNLIWISSTLQT